jgi:hypothetical protein
MCVLCEVGATFAGCVGEPRAGRNKAGNKQVAHIESDKEEGEISKLERNLYIIRKQLDDFMKDDCWNFRAAECTMGRLKNTAIRSLYTQEVAI